VHYPGVTLKLCGANEAQRWLRPNERLVINDYPVTRDATWRYAINQLHELETA
jgi:hypothetical protein